MGPLGQQIGNIRVDALLGKGGMGEVYRGFDVRLERHVAIKSLRLEHRLDGEAKARFLREARILSRLESSSICRVFDLLEDDEADYLIFEYVEGETLRQLLKRKRLEQTEALNLAEKIAQGLAIAHRERIVHRDLKPENIMVTPEGEVKLLDFGISHAVRELHTETEQAAAIAAVPGVSEAAPTDVATVSMESGPTQPWTLPVAATDRSASDRSASDRSASDGSANDRSASDRSASDRVDTDFHTETLVVESQSGPRLGLGDSQHSESGLSRDVSESSLSTGPSDSAPSDSALSDSVLSESGLSVRLTQRGSMVGTLTFMSPEQAAGKDLTEASDMFSFGLVLQEMLSGVPAYEAIPFALLIRRVAAGETQPMPEERIDPDAVRLVHDLLRTKPDARPTADQAVDSLRWVLDRPKRQLRRQRRQRLASAAFALLVVVLAIVSVLAVRADRAATLAEQETLRAEAEARRAYEQAVRADQEAEKTREVANFLVDLFEAANPDEARGRDVNVREILERGAERIERELPGQPLVRARLKDTLGTIYWRLGDYGTAERLLTAALATRRELLSGDHAERAQSKRQLAALYADQGRLEQAEPLLQEAIAALTRQEDADPGLTASTLNDLATLKFEQGEFEVAERLYQRALELRQSVDPDSIDVAAVLNNLAVLAWQLGDYGRASDLYQQSLEIHEQALGADHPDLAALFNNLGILHRRTGELETAEQLHGKALEIAEAALGSEHPDVAAILDSLARVLVLGERLDEAQPLFERAYAIRSEVVGADSYETGRTLTSLGDLLRLRGDLQRSKRMLRRARRQLGNALGEQHPWTLEAVHALANVLRDLGEKEQAAALYTQALATAAEVLGAEHPEVEAIRRNQQRLTADEEDSVGS